MIAMPAPVIVTVSFPLEFVVAILSVPVLSVTLTLPTYGLPSFFSSISKVKVVSSATTVEGLIVLIIFRLPVFLL